MIQPEIKKILEVAINAPSGDNVQPWKIILSGNSLELCNLPNRDSSLYNFNQAASLIGHGALIENIEIAAKEFGYKVLIELFPKSSDNHTTDIVAKIDFQKADTKKDPLFEFIPQRITNRKKYNSDLLTDHQKKSLSDLNSNLKLVDDREGVKSLAEISSLNEQLVLENQKMHQFLFQHVTWTKQESEEKRSGLYIQTLEMPKPAEIVFRAARHWSRMKFLNKLGLSKKVSKENKKVYQHSAGFAAIAIPNYEGTSFINLGRLLERAWLKATELGISIQPLTGITFLYQAIQRGNKDLDSQQIELIQQGYNKMAQIFGVKEEKIGFVFRYGISEAPSAPSPKYLFEEVVVEKNA
jgi:hypothetical protein